MVREITFRAAQRRGVNVVVVANRGVRVPSSAHIRTVVVAQGADVADAHIVAEFVQPQCSVQCSDAHDHHACTGRMRAPDDVGAGSVARVDHAD